MTAADRAALLRKYRLLAAWRAARDTAKDGVGDKGPDRRALAALSQEFPGALRELDVLGLPEISRRIDWLMGHGNGERDGHGDGDGDGDGDDHGHDWIAWISAYHGIMRAALLAKRVAGRTRRISSSDMARMLRDAAAVA
ncbi:MAG: hypothetical protein ABUL77_00020, partial [Bacteroidota bacterium]